MEYKKILENISGWLWTVDTSGKYTYSSQNVFDFLGYTEEEVIGKTPFNFMSEEESSRVSKLFKDFVTHRAPIKELENEVIHKDGSIVILKTSAIPVYDENGVWLGYEGIDQDVTYEKNLEKELELSYAKLHKLTEHVPGAIYQFRLYPDGRMTFPYGSNGTQEIWELTPNDLINDATPGLNRIHPEDVEMMVTSIENSAKTMKIWNLEYRHNLPKKGLRWLHGHAKPEKLEDGSILWHGYVYDITEQKKIELELIKTQERLSLNNQINRTIIDTIPVRIFWQDNDCKYLGANKVFLDDANLNTEQDIVGKSDFELPWAELAQNYIDDDLKVINSGIAKLNIIETLKVKDGKILDIQTSKSPLRDKDDNIIGLVCTFVDITEEKEKEKLLNQQSKMATMGEMIGNIAHQWKQPLSLISMSNGLLEIHQKDKTFCSEEYIAEAIANINASVKHLSSTIDDFRNFFIPDKQKVEVQLKTIYEKTYRLISSQFKNNAIEIVVDLQDIKIFGYSNELLQVLINIIKNARDELIERATDQKKLIFINGYKENEKIIIKIKDNAGGIPKDIINKIFNAYFTTKQDNEGTGIGLYMSKQIIEGMDGIIQVSNVNYSYEEVEYSGAEFVIELQQ